MQKKMKKSEIIKDIDLAFERIQKIEDEYKAKKTSCEKYIDFIKSKLLSSFGFSEGDEVTLIIHEYRDDRVHCFATAQTVNLFIKDIRYFRSEKKGGYLIPVLLKKKTSKRPINFNWSLSWTLKKGEEIIIEHFAEEFIIPGTYSEEQLKNTREILSTIQKIA